MSDRCPFGYLLDILLRVYCDTTRLLNFGRPSILQCAVVSPDFYDLYVFQKSRERV